MNAPIRMAQPSPAEQLAALNHSGQYRRALKRAEQLEFTFDKGIQKLDAAFWLQRLVAFELKPGSHAKETRVQYTAFAKKAEGYDQRLHSDALRTIAAEFVHREKHPLLRGMFLDEAYRLASDDEHRLAMIYMVRGRSHFGLREHEEARVRHETAKLIWSNLGDTARQQFDQDAEAQRAYQENEFYLFRSLCVLQDRDSKVNIARQHIVLENGPSLGPPWRIRQHLLYLSSGRLAPRLDRCIERFMRM